VQARTLSQHRVDSPKSTRFLVTRTSDNQVSSGKTMVDDAHPTREPMRFTTRNERPAISGEVDLLSVPQLEQWLSELGEEAEVDLSGVTFFDSSALRAFLNARRRNPSLRVVEPSAAVARVLEITGLGDYLLHGRDW
jgi:anti-anti-sigma factor